MLELGDEKMSKSLGNIAPLAEVLDRWPAEVVIAFFLTSHYRSRLPFTEERMAEAAAVVERLSERSDGPSTGHRRARRGPDPDLTRAVVEGRGAFFRALDDDFGTPAAFAALFDMVRGGQPRRSPGPRRAPASSARPAASCWSCSTCSASRRSARPRPPRGARRGHGAR